MPRRRIMPLVLATAAWACGGDDGVMPPAVPEAVFAQPPQDQGVNYVGSHYADDFTLPASTTISEFRWWGGDGSSTGAIRIFADDGSGSPAATPLFEVLNPTVVADSAASVVPRVATIPVFENRATLSNVPTLTAGTRYYVSISILGFWLSSNAPGTEWWWRTGAADPWTNASSTNPNNLAFELLGVTQ